MKPIYKYIFFIALFAILGFSREFLFVNINNQLYKLYYGYSNLPLPNSLHFLTLFNYTNLYYTKYILTILFYLCYVLISFLAVKTISQDKKYSQWIIYIYVLLLFLASLSMAYNYIVNNRLSGNEYTFSRWLMGIAQSPLVAFFIIASDTLYKKNQTKKN